MTYKRIALRALKWITALIILAALGGTAKVVLGRWRVQPQHSTPTTLVRRGQLDLRVYARGELHTVKSQMIMAPSVGGNLVIVKLAKTGEHVHKDDIIIEFDPGEQEHTLQQNHYDLLQAEQEIEKAKADSAVQAAQDQVALLKAKYDVRRAELDVSRNPLVSAIDAKKNLLALDEAKRRLEQLEQDIHSHTQSNQASVAVAEEKKRKAQLMIKQAQDNIKEMRVPAPLEGLISVKENWGASGGFFFSGMKLPEYRTGDQVQPGSPVAEVLDVSAMEIQTKVNESDRGNLKKDAPVEIRIDALPDALLSGKVKTIAELASRGAWWSTSSTSKFDVSVQVDNSKVELRPGLTAEAVIQGGEVRDALIVPRQAIFEKEGKPVVYTRLGARFEPKTVKITNRTESQVGIEGLPEGTEVALVNPELEEKKGGAAGSSGPAVTGGAK